MLVQVHHKPPLDQDFQPALLWHRAYLALSKQRRNISIALKRNEEHISVFHGCMLPDLPKFRQLNHFYLERLLKFLLWQRGAGTLLIDGAPECVPSLAQSFSPTGLRSFDCQLIGVKVFDHPLKILAQEEQVQPFPAPCEEKASIGNHFEGCRIGFDLGGSDRKCAALIDGKVVFSEEVPWDPYFQKDPEYHRMGIIDSLNRAASKLPRIDAIGGSAAGIYRDNLVRVASLFRGVPEDLFNQEVRPIFLNLSQKLGSIPFVVINDGDVTALAGSKYCEGHSLLGIAMGTSQAVGYVNEKGSITPWLNELAFAPVDYRIPGPVDEWSGDQGCGVQYFSQQAVARLFPATGLPVDMGLKPPEMLEHAQNLIKEGNYEAMKIFQSIGIYLAFSLGHYASFYNFHNVMLLGRVMSGDGGQEIMNTCKKILPEITGEWGQALTFITPDETFKRHGQAIAAAGLPEYTGPGPSILPKNL